MLRVLLASFFCLLFLFLSSYFNIVHAKKRLALVIGNSDYQNSPLTNSKNDALDMTAALRKLNFEVDSYINLDRSEMRKAIRTFGEKLKHADVGLFYYAGHGIQLNGRNYLIPLKTDVSSADEVQDESIDASSILRKMKSAGNDINIVILDACRNNPFARSFRSLNQGLARMDGPVGSFIAYATAPGSVASDGSGRNGLYTKYLLEALSKPGLAIEQTFKSVRNSVQLATDGKQIPWESSSLMGEFMFLANIKNEPAPTTKPQAPIVTKKHLQVITNVPNARVTINNIDRGFVNNKGILNIENIMEDQVEVLVQADGYKMERSKVALVPNQWEQLKIVLTPVEPLKSVENNRQTNSNTCIENKTTILTSKVEFQSDSGKSIVKRNMPELKILLMQALTKYGLKFSNADLPNNIDQPENSYKVELLNAIERIKPTYLLKYSSIVNERPIKIIKTNMKTITGDLSLELIDVKSREVLGYATKSFRQAGMDRRNILIQMLSKEIENLTDDVITQVICVE